MSVSMNVVLLLGLGLLVVVGIVVAGIILLAVKKLGGIFAGGQQRPRLRYCS